MQHVIRMFYDVSVIHTNPRVKMRIQQRNDWACEGQGKGYDTGIIRMRQADREHEWKERHSANKAM